MDVEGRGVRVGFPSPAPHPPWRPIWRGPAGRISTTADPSAASEGAQPNSERMTKGSILGAGISGTAPDDSQDGLAGSSAREGSRDCCKPLETV